MTLRQKIGQMTFAGLRSSKLDEEFARLIEEYKIGNVILFSRNVENALQVKNLNIELQKLIRGQTGYPAFISIDQEGGMVTRLTQDCTNMPGAMAVAATGNPDNARIAGEITGRELRALGININLAPVMDVNSNPANPVIGVRSYGDTPETVSSYGIQMMRGLKNSGVMAVLKHFPGHGDTSVDSHLDLPVIDKPLCELEKADFMPFKNAIDCGAEAVMTSHILFPQICNDNYPATMSRTIITGLLKERMGFKGLVMTDCLEMDAIKKYYGTAKGAVEAIKAGADMVFISHSAGLVKEAVELIENAVMTGELPVERLDEAVDKILKYKSKYACYDVNSTDFSVVGCRAHRNQAQRISSESVTLVRDDRGQLPVKSKNIISVGFPPGLSSNVVSPMGNAFNFPDFMAGKLGGESMLIGAVIQEKDMERVLEAAKGKDAVLFGTYNGHLHKGQLEILNRLCMEHDNVIAVVLGNPYDISEVSLKAAVIATYEYTPLSLETLAKVIKGEVTPAGKMSVKL